MSIVPSVMQVFGFAAQESAHPLELTLICEVLSLEGAEQLSGVEHEYAFSRGHPRQGGGEPVDRCLDGFRSEIPGRGGSKN